MKCFETKLMFASYDANGLSQSTHKTHHEGDIRSTFTTTLTK